MNTQIAFDALPGIWCMVDADSRYTYYNQAYANLVGVGDKPRDFLIGKTVADMPCNAAQCAPLFWEADALVKDSRKMVRVLHSIQMACEQWKILQIDKQPVLDAAGSVVAIIFHIIDHSANHMLDLAMSVSKDLQQSNSANATVLISSNAYHLEIDLKPKESECLFYLSRGFSYKEIAQIQDVAYRTVVDHIERLKMKFDVPTTAELVNRALANGYPKTLPQKYFKKQISIILSAAAATV
jgi:DNA-binding CsgD family transcriptional regulator